MEAGPREIDPKGRETVPTRAHIPGVVDKRPLNTAMSDSEVLLKSFAVPDLDRVVVREFVHDGRCKFTSSKPPNQSSDSDASENDCH